MDEPCIPIQLNLNLLATILKPFKIYWQTLSTSVSINECDFYILAIF